MDTTPSLLDLARRFPTEAAAESWFLKMRWPGGVRCPQCYSKDVQERPNRKGLSTWHQMECLVDGVFVGKRLSYADLGG